MSNLGKIFMADDDKDDWLVIDEAMSEVDPDVQIVFAEDGEELVRLLDNYYNEKTLPSLIILDMNMPKLTGTQTLQKIKNDPRFTDIPVVIYSTSVNTFEKTRCFDLGAVDYLTKPMNYSESLNIAKIFRNFLQS